MIKIFGEIGHDITAEMFDRMLAKESGDLDIIMDSPGGCVFEGISIFNSIRDYNRGTVSMVIKSLCASIASYIAMSADNLSVYDNSSFMFHNAHAGGYGDASKLESLANALHGVNSLLLDAYERVTSKSREELKNLMSAETYLFGEDIIKFGFANALVGDKKERTTGQVEALVATAKTKIVACIRNCKNKETHIDTQEIANLLLSSAKENKLLIEANNIMEKYKR